MAKALLVSYNVGKMNTLKRLACLTFALAWSASGVSSQPQAGFPAHSQVAQHRCYVATCSRNDLYQRFADVAEARRAAAQHSQSTGHATSVILE